MSGRCADSLEESSSGPTRYSQVGVGLDLSRQIAGETLKHAGVVRQETVDLQAAPYQHPVPGDLDRTDGHRVFVPHDIRLRCSCTKRRGLLYSHLRRRRLCLLFSRKRKINTEEVKKKKLMKALTSCLTGDIHHLFHLRADVTRWLFDKQRILCFQREKH